MDPDATLAAARELADETINNGAITLARSMGLALALRDLDEWLTGGGYLPTDWSATRRPVG